MIKKTLYFTSLLLVSLSTLIYSQNFLPESRKGDWLQAGYLRLLAEELALSKLNNVLDYGATNDGNDVSNNNQVSIMNAIADRDAAGVTQIYFPSGTYKISSPISISGISGIILRGAGSSNTRLIFNFNNQNNMSSIHITSSENIGIENLYIEREDHSDFGDNITISATTNSWVSGVEIYRASANNIMIHSSANIDILGCHIHHNWNYGTGGHGYGVTLGSGTTKCLIENNILNHMRHSVIMSNGPTSNVVGYNYSTDPYTTEVWFGINDWPSDMCLHGHPDASLPAPSMNLFEGNICAFMHADDAWNDNGPYNTYFRNRATYYGVRIYSASPNQNIIANEVDDSDGDLHDIPLGDLLWNAFDIESTGNFVVGNTNFDPSPPQYPPPSDYSGDLSLYLDPASLPGFLQSLAYFPPIGVVDAGHMGGGTIPAKMRWDAGVILTVTHPEHDLLVNVLSVGNGDVTPGGIQRVGYNSVLGVTANPHPNYVFSHWTVTPGITIESSDATGEFRVTRPGVITSFFEINEYTLTYLADPNGSISGTTPQTVTHGSDGSAVEANPSFGYHFVEWSDGSRVNPRTDTDVTGDVTVTAFFEINHYTLAYLAAPNGSISGATPQIVTHGSDGTAVEANPSFGYHFVEWSDGSTVNPRTDRDVAGDVTVTAFFEINKYTLTYLAASNGSISGTTPQMVNHGSDGTAVEANPSFGYHFVEWSDGSTVNPRTDRDVAGDVTVTAFFEINEYTLTYLVDQNGSISGTTPQMVNHGSDGTAVEANPSFGYHFVEWSDGSKVNPRRETGVTADMTVSASFAINLYILTYLADPNGTVSGTTQQIVPYGSDGSAVEAKPAVGYHFVEWSDGSRVNPRTDTEVTGDITVSAFFANNLCILTYLAGKNGNVTGTTQQIVPYGSDGSAVEAKPAVGYHFVEWSDGSRVNPRKETGVTADMTVTASFAINLYTLSYLAGPNGTVNGTMQQIVKHSSDGSKVEAIPSPGYHFYKWSDGSTDNSRTERGVTSDITVTAGFEINTYTLTYTAGPNGSISGENSQTIDHGSHGSEVEAIPFPGYHFFKWSDGNSDNPRTERGVTSDVTVTAEFEINTYTLTYTAGPNGSISGESSQTIDHGSYGSEVEAVPNKGYKFVDWSDGRTDNPRTDNHVNADITVTANFDAVTAIVDQEETVTYTDIVVVPNPVKTEAGYTDIIVHESTTMSEARLLIFDPLGNCLYEQNRKMNTRSACRFRWDLRNVNGRFAGTGMYKAMVLVRYKDGSAKRFSAFIGIKK